MQMQRNPVIKVLILGDAAVGKTSLMQQYVQKKFLTDYKSTIGADFLMKDIVIEGVTFALQVPI